MSLESNRWKGLIIPQLVVAVLFSLAVVIGKARGLHGWVMQVRVFSAIAVWISVIVSFYRANKK